MPSLACAFYDVKGEGISLGYILSIDQGTTSSRAIIFDGDMQPIAQGQQEFPQYYPNNGWVEHSPEDLWQTTLQSCRTAIEKANIDSCKIDGIGITNQRETTLLWDRNTGEPIYNAIVWQDRRTADICETLKQQGCEPLITQKTGLLLDPYFSATKIAWILNHVEGARDKAVNGDLLFGTVDSYLMYKLTGGNSHVTDATNAARTSLFDIHKGVWCEELCKIFNIPASILPKVKDCAADFGVIQEEILGSAIPILGVAGDQQAATIGQACFEPGMMKSTYGTGCFALLNTGSEAVASQNKLLTTIAYQLDGEVTYALEGSIFIAGAVVQWLRDGLKIIEKASDTHHLAEQADASENVILVPAFTGLGAPYWQPDCRGGIFGITRNSGPEEMAKAALQSVGYQTRDLLEAMQADWKVQGHEKNILRVDGGMSASDWTMQFLSDILNSPVDRPSGLETTALGAAWLAGMRAGIYPDKTNFAKQWALEKRFEPLMGEELREEKYDLWKKAIAAVQML